VIIFEWLWGKAVLVVISISLLLVT
jgi:hypothetical protein